MTASITQHKLLSGDMYTVGRGVTLADTASMSVYIENPSGSGTTVVVDTQTVTADGSATGTYYRNPDVSGGNDGSSSNDLIGSSETSVLSITNDGTLSNADSTTNFGIASTGPGFGLALAERPPIALQPGNSIAVEVTSTEADNNITALFTVYETERGTDA